MLAVIMAGGEGTRLKPYTTVIPKPLLPVGEKPILEIVIRQLKNEGFEEVIITTGYQGDLIKAYFQDGATVEDAMVEANIKIQMMPPDFREQVRSRAYEGIWKPWMERGGPATEESFNELAKLLIAKGHDVPGYTPY